MRNRASSRDKRALDEKRAQIDWDFNSFPTYFGIAAGAFGATVLIAIGLYPVVFMGSLFATTFCMVHAGTRYIVRNRRAKAADKAEEEELERRALAARMAANARDEGLPAPRKRRRRR